VLQQEIVPHIQDGLVGSAEYTLTLVNKMEPTSLKKDLKREKFYNMGKASVSWHKDSGLVDFSSIAVYHSLRNVSDINTNSTTENVPWRVALRVASKDTQTPPLSVPLPSGSLYYLLDDFNHQHEHTVLAGSSQLRYSSTHRVERKGRGTWQYIRNKSVELLGNGEHIKSDDEQKLSEKRSDRIKRTRAQQQLLTEIEFEWLRQWYIQGKEHAMKHPYWHKPMKLLESWFEQLHNLTEEILGTLQAASKLDNSSGITAQVSDALFDVMIEAFEERAQLHDLWNQREKDSVFDTMPQQCRPFSSDTLDKWTKQDAHASISDIRKWRKAFVKRQRGDNSASSSHSNLTKKEKKKVASNWEAMLKAMTSKK
jgi:alpha-ketoglutarate-dependent dioxygenase FTO